MCFVVLLLLIIFVICLSSYLLNHVFYSWYFSYLLQLFSTSRMSTSVKSAFLNFLVSLISFIPCSYSPLIVLTCTLTCILFTNDRTGSVHVPFHLKLGRQVSLTKWIRLYEHKRPWAEVIFRVKCRQRWYYIEVCNSWVQTIFCFKFPLTFRFSSRYGNAACK